MTDLQAENKRLREAVEAAYDYLIFHDDRLRALSVLTAAGLTEADMPEGLPDPQ